MAVSVPLFVYGTLMQAQRSHAFLEESEFLGAATTCEPFRMVDLGPYPGVVDPAINNTEAAQIQGELYTVDAATLAALDRFEDHPRLYRRVQIDLRTEAGTSHAWIYLLQRDHDRVITSGVWPPS